METIASPSFFSSSTSLSTVIRRRRCSSRASILPDRTSSPSALRRNFPSSLCCRASMSNSTRTSETEIKKSYPEEFNGSKEFSIMSLSPLDGRYLPKVKNLRPLFSKYGLLRSRIMVEVKWLIKLSEIPEVEEVPELSVDARSFLKAIVDKFSVKDSLEVKKIMEKTNHDVKAVKYFMKRKCESCPEVAKVLEFFHFLCTSEDIDNLAYAISLKEALNTVIFPVMVELSEAISTLAKNNAHIPMLSRTHGQPASPTTLGKEMSVFAFRLCNKGEIFSGLHILGKFAGAVGNYNAHKFAYPNVNWPSIAEEFVTSLGIEFNANGTHIEPHDYIVSLFHAIIGFNNIVLNFDRDIWSYISLGYFKQITKSTEVGSSTMPQKVNPIDFENSEGNLGLANKALSELAMRLSISRMQGDLSDYSVLRSTAAGLGHSLLAYLSTLQGIQKLEVNEFRLNEDLERSWDVLAEPIQIVMRRHGIPGSYEKLKDFTRGKNVTKESITELIKGLDLSENTKSDLLDLTPSSYTGEAKALATSLDDAIDPLNGFRI
ncbi:hypothetical protein KSP40_PGU009622 [Platanthera guangdongensis]|uniref:Adenylosuccinate lyase n=1 Tax=Platanthera guangdongensis TaxID=2320717 RepID=A0ABR2N653_9ASPA